LEHEIDLLELRHRGRDHDGNELTIRIAPTDDLKGVVLVTGF